MLLRLAAALECNVTELVTVSNTLTTSARL